MNRKNIKSLDKLWSELVRAKGYCEYCGKTEALAAHHIFTRSKRSTRWDVENGVCLCYKCHIHWAHKDAVGFTWWLEGKRGVKKLEKLRKKSNKLAGKQYFEDIQSELMQERLDNIKSWEDV